MAGDLTSGRHVKSQLYYEINHFRYFLYCTVKCIYNKNIAISLAKLLTIASFLSLSLFKNISNMLLQTIFYIYFALISNLHYYNFNPKLNYLIFKIRLLSWFMWNGKWKLWLRYKFRKFEKLFLYILQVPLLASRIKP